MGVKITDLMKPSVKPIVSQNLIGKTIAIDSFNMLYQFLASIRGIDGSPLKDRHGNITSHLSGLIARNVYFIEQGIRPIYVFDGKPNVLKQQEINKRREMRKIAQNKMANAEDDENDAEIQKFAKGTSMINAQIIAESKEFISFFGFPIIQAIEDGEAQAAYLIQKNKAFACGSQDYDAFLFGANRIVRNLSANQTKTVNGISKKIDIEFYSLDQCLQNLQITREQLVDIGILIGVDFFIGIKGIGEKTAYKLITEYGNIETVKSSTSTHDFSVLTPEFLETVRTIFLQPKITDDFTIQWNKIQYEKIIETLVESHDFNKDRVENWMKRLKAKSSTKIQSTLEFLVKK